MFLMYSTSLLFIIINQLYEYTEKVYVEIARKLKFKTEFVTVKRWKNTALHKVLSKTINYLYVLSRGKM